ncbi:MAG: phosphate propanoyltransferase [Spirochaetia bacterium]
MSESRGDSVRRLGEYLVETQALRHEQIGLLLEEQRGNAAVGVHSRIGEIAVRRGWAEADQVTSALKVQAEEEIGRSDAGQTLLALGWLTRKQLDDARRRCARSSETLEEAIIELGFSTPERLRLAGVLAAIRSATAVRRISGSSFSPYNVMELIVGEETNAAIRADSLCTCSQCWSNVYALALNAMPARYVSDHGRILDYYRRFREEYGSLARERVAAALSQVRSNPKASCLSRFSAEILAGRESEARVHEVTVRISAHHVHLSEKDMARLFGPGASLSRLKDLHQPGQFAANETVTLTGPKGSIEHVRILGPLRERTQVEISGTDQFSLGVQAPVRESGRLEETPGIRLRGPAGELEIPDGVIRALRHIHMPPEDADRIGVRNGTHVSVRLVGDRATIAEGVLVRVAPQAVLEMHIDTDEGNAAGVAAESTGQILIPLRAV